MSCHGAKLRVSWPAVSPLEPEELLARLRVITSYKARGRDDEVRAALLAEAHIPATQYKNWNDRSKPTVVPTLDDLVALAEAAGVPRRFAERGFEDLEEATPTAGNAQLRSAIEKLRDEVRQLREQVAGKEDRLTDDRLGEILGPAALAAVQGSLGAAERTRLGGDAPDRLLGSRGAGDE